MLQRKTPLRRGGTLRRTSGLRPVSDRRRRELAEYAKRRKAYLASHPICEVWLRENHWQPCGNDHCGDRMGGPGNIPTWRRQTFPGGHERLEFVHAPWLMANGAPAATEIHHTNKRRGKMLNDESYWLAVCHENHERIEQNKAWARAAGFLLNF